MVRFAVGDRVRCSISTEFARKGDTGTVQEISRFPFVKWDGKTWKGTEHGWYAIGEKDLDLIKGDTMDKSQAIKRLYAIEAEAKELRKVIEGKITFDKNKIYVAIWRNEPHILVGSNASEYYRFHDLTNTIRGIDSSMSNGQDVIDSASEQGTIHEFTDTRTALQFSLDNLK